MIFKIGQKVTYPNHGVCAIESVDSRKISGAAVDFYILRLLAFNSVILVPTANAESIGIRPLISGSECREVLSYLAEDFDEIETDWKIRIRDYLAKVRTGNIFEVAAVLKKLTFLTQTKLLSFREKSLLEKTKFLIVSELAAACAEPENEIETKVERFLSESCAKHLLGKIPIISHVAH